MSLPRGFGAAAGCMGTSPLPRTEPLAKRGFLQRLCMGGSHVRGCEPRLVPLWELMPCPTLPPAAPAVAPDVWRRLGPMFPNGSHEVTVLIKVRSFLAAPVKFSRALLLPEDSTCQEAMESNALPKEPFDQSDVGKMRPQRVLGAKSLHPCKIHLHDTQPRGHLSCTGAA